MLTLPYATEEFLQHCRFEKNLSFKTNKFYGIDLSQFSIFLKTNEFTEIVKEIDKNHLKLYLQSIAHFMPKSIKRKMATLNAFFNYLEFEEKILFNPLRKIRIKIKEPFVLPKVMNLVEIEKIFKSAYKMEGNKINALSDVELRNIVVLGARVSEVANLKATDIDFHTGTINIQGKGNKERIISISNPDSLVIIEGYCKKFKDKIDRCNGYLLINRLNKKLSDQSIRSIVKNISKSAKIGRNITPHVFRHSFATLLLENEVDIKYIQSMLGHSSIMTTQIYTHVNKEKQRQILIAKHPRKSILLVS